MRWWGWSVVALAAVGLGACERTSSSPVVVKEAPLESEGVIGGADVAEFRGTVTAVGGTQFIVRGENGEEQPFEIDDQTDFIRGGNPVERLELQEGAQVRTRYDVREGEKVADEVEIY
ncbi:MAG TPA: DUF5666 domain-containing protein [Hyalangium sp.]|nr:DUF5666 domain-containing protein [Hyalangium sp.]